MKSVYKAESRPFAVPFKTSGFVCVYQSYLMARTHSESLQLPHCVFDVPPLTSAGLQNQCIAEGDVGLYHLQTAACGPIHNRFILQVKCNIFMGCEVIMNILSTIKLVIVISGMWYNNGFSYHLMQHMILQVVPMYCIFTLNNL